MATAIYLTVGYTNKRLLDILNRFGDLYPVTNYITENLIDLKLFFVWPATGINNSRSG